MADIPDMPDYFAGFGYNGSSVRMVSCAGVLLADLMHGVTPDLPFPQALCIVPKRLPLGPYRRHLICPLYQWMGWQDL